MTSSSQKVHDSNYFFYRTPVIPECERRNPKTDPSQLLGNVYMHERASKFVFQDCEYSREGAALALAARHHALRVFCMCGDDDDDRGTLQSQAGLEFLFRDVPCSLIRVK